MADTDLTEAYRLGTEAMHKLRYQDGPDGFPMLVAGSNEDCAHTVVDAVAPLLIEQGRRQVLDMILGHEAARIVADRSGAAMHDVEAALDELHERLTATEPLSCGCPPEHHDEAIRRAADPAERRALLARLTQQSLELGTYDKTAPEES